MIKTLIKIRTAFMHQLILLATNHPMFWAHYVPTCSTLTKAKCNHSPCPPLATLVTPTSLFLQAIGWPLYTWPHSQMGSVPLANGICAPVVCTNHLRVCELLNSWTLEVVVSWSDGLLNSNHLWCRPLRKKDPRKMLPGTLVGAKGPEEWILHILRHMPLPYLQ